MTVPARYKEGVILVKQDNITQTLSIVGMSDTLRDMLELDPDTMPNTLHQILGKKTARTVVEDVEYEDDRRDLLEVLKHHSRIKLRKVNGAELTYHCQIMRSVAQDRHHLFRIILSDPAQQQETKTIKQVLDESFEGHKACDIATGLPDRTSLKHYLALMHSYLGNQGIHHCFIAMQLSQNGFNETQYNDLLKHASAVIQRNLRADDLIGRINSNTLGIILTDINQDTVHLAMNRLKQTILRDVMIPKDPSPSIRQAGILSTMANPDDMVARSISLLNADKTRDMVMIRQNIHTKAG